MTFRFCPICKHDLISTAFKGGAYEIVQCQRCLFGWLKDYPGQKELKKIYQSEYFADKQSRDYAADAQKKYDFVKDFLKQKARILDFGCGLGFFLGVCRKQGHEVYGYDISAFAARKVWRKYKISVKYQPLEDNLFQQGFFDAVCCFDVIEHTPLYRKTLKLFHRWLKKGGQLFITTPDMESWDKKLLQYRWYGFTKLPQHINYFSRKSMAIELERAEFKTILLKTFGFVRSPDFIFAPLSEKIPPLYLGVKNILNVLGLWTKPFYFPMIDMMAVAQKQYPISY